jgi:hypothetical protein
MACWTTGDEESPALVDGDADGRAAASRLIWHDDRLGTGAEIAAHDGAGRDRADVERVSRPDGDSLRTESVGEVDVSGESTCGRGHQR